MDLEKTILDQVRKLPLSKREKVLKLVESIADSDENDDSEITLASDETQSLWRDWVAAGPQGPIEVEGTPEFP